MQNSHLQEPGKEMDQLDKQLSKTTDDDLLHGQRKQYKHLYNWLLQPQLKGEPRATKFQINLEQNPTWVGHNLARPQRLASHMAGQYSMNTLNFRTDS